jgi:ATP-dependent DNA helicase RecQ
VAAACGLTVPQLRQLLYRTSLEHVIKYIPGDRCSIVFLHHNRLTPGNVDLQKEKYAFLLGNARARSDAMVEYASQGTRCRSRWLLSYFGQEESDDCGTCDVCRTGNRHSSPDPEPPAPEAAIRRWWEEHPGASLQEFRAWCADPAGGAPPDALVRYRKMLDEGRL